MTVLLRKGSNDDQLIAALQDELKKIKVDDRFLILIGNCIQSRGCRKMEEYFPKPKRRNCCVKRKTWSTSQK
jgi:hypothetical protein